MRPHGAHHLNPAPSRPGSSGPRALTAAATNGALHLSTTLTHASEPTVRAALRSPKLLRTEVLAGLVVALALIPEAISFSIIAGVDPRIGLFASFTMAVAISFL